MNENNDNQNPNEDSGKLSNSFLDAAIVILGAAVLTVSAPLTVVAAGALAVGAVVREIEKS